MSEKKEGYVVEEIEALDSELFDRQKRIKGWDQSKISNATVMVIGAGAVGNELVKNLAKVTNSENASEIIAHRD